MFLQLKNLTKTFPGRGGTADVTAVNDVTVQIEQGHFVTLLGPSGCGKTTTLRLIAGFEFPSGGDIILDGERINEQPPNVRDMAMVFQSYAIFPHLTVFENIAYGLKIRKLGRKEIARQVDRALAMTELDGLGKRAPNELSGGQQQRVALARALVMQPKVLLFDEPLSNLDAKLRVQMRSEIRRIQQELGITSVYVTHDQDEAMVLSDLIVIMDQGRIQQKGTAVEIYRRPQNLFVADFIGQANFLPVDIRQQKNEAWDVELFGRPLTIAAASTNVAAGTEGQLLLRPESIRLHVNKPSADTWASAGSMLLEGTVRRTAYLGSLAEYDIDVEGHLVAAILYDPSEEQLYPVGSQVWLELLEENLYLLAE